MVRDWMWLQRTQWFGKEQIGRIQSRRFREVVNHSIRNVPFYTKLYRSAGVDPSSIEDTSSIGKLPVITKRQIIDTPLEQRTAADSDLTQCIARTTSGATGEPVTVLEEPRSASYRSALWLRRFSTYGVRAWDRACMVVPGHHRRALISETKGLTGLLMGRKIIRLSLESNLQKHLELFAKWKPTVLVGPPSYYRSLIRFLEQKGGEVYLKVAIANGEMLDGLTRKLMINAFQTENVFEAYGAVEVGSIGWECPSHSGFHLNAESLIVEFLRDGVPVAPGEPGEICVTNLYRKVTPMIRYTFGDIGTRVDDDCSCGRGLPLMKEKQGRTLDFILRKNGETISPFRVMFMLEDVSGIAQYKVIQEKDYSVELLVVPSRGGADPLVRMLEDRCAGLFSDLPWRVRAVDSIAKSMDGKVRVVESRLSS